MRSDFFDRVVVLMSIAWAMAWSSSRSLDSSTDRSSCCSAVIGLLIFWYRKGLYLCPYGENRGWERAPRNGDGPPSPLATKPYRNREWGLGKRSEARVV